MWCKIYCDYTQYVDGGGWKIEDGKSVAEKVKEHYVLIQHKNNDQEERR